MGTLGYLKNYHSQFDLINDTPIMDKIIAQRNFLQCCGYIDLNGYFNPYLFNLSSLTKDMCKEEDFRYP